MSDKKTDIDRVFPEEEIYEGFTIGKLKPKQIKKIMGVGKEIANKIRKKWPTKKDKEIPDIEIIEVLDIAFDEVEAIIMEVCQVSKEKFEDTDIEIILEVAEKIIKKNEGIIDRFFGAKRSLVAVINKATSGK